jgi:hypothetical protein
MCEQDKSNLRISDMQLTTFWIENLNGGVCFENQDMDTDILKWVSKKKHVRVWAVLI